MITEPAFSVISVVYAIYPNKYRPSSLAREADHVIKLIASMDEDGAVVKPRSIPKKSPLNVSESQCLTYRTKLAGKITIIGCGAGRVETTSTILRDLIEIRSIRTMRQKPLLF